MANTTVPDGGGAARRRRRGRWSAAGRSARLPASGAAIAVRLARPGAFAEAGRRVAAGSGGFGARWRVVAAVSATAMGRVWLAVA
jgi:hypothetical protein